MHDPNDQILVSRDMLRYFMSLAKKDKKDCHAKRDESGEIQAEEMIAGIHEALTRHALQSQSG